MAFDNEYQSQVITYPTFTELGDILGEQFEVVTYSMEYGLPTFTFKWPGDVIPNPEDQDVVFAEVGEKAKRLKVWPVIRWFEKDEGTYFVRFVPIQTPGKSDITLNYALFIATLGTIALAALLQVTSPIFLTLFYPSGYDSFTIIFEIFAFMAALMGIIFTHEMGHYLTAKKKGIEATPPYFLPGLPWIGGTFGAFQGCF